MSETKYIFILKSNLNWLTREKHLTRNGNYKCKWVYFEYLKCHFWVLNEIVFSWIKDQSSWYEWDHWKASSFEDVSCQNCLAKYEWLFTMHIKILRRFPLFVASSRICMNGCKDKRCWVEKGPIELSINKSATVNRTRWVQSIPVHKEAFRIKVGLWKQFQKLAVAAGDIFFCVSCSCFCQQNLLDKSDI